MMKTVGLHKPGNIKHVGSICSGVSVVAANTEDG